MTCTTRILLLVATLAAGSAMAASHAHAPTYILDGYKFSQPVPGVNTTDLEAKLKHKPGARVTEDDLDGDQDILNSELRARHIQGQIQTGLVERRGHVWVVVGYADLPKPPTRHLELQRFEGESRIPASALLAATNLKGGVVLSPKNINAARQAILALYAKAMPHKVVDVKIKVQIMRKNGNVILNWLIHEPK